MDNESPRLRPLLEALHTELSNMPEADSAERRAQLTELKQDVEGLLADRVEGEQGSLAVEAGSVEQRQRLQTRLQNVVNGFENAHPQLASALEQTMNALSNMGL